VLTHDILSAFVRSEVRTWKADEPHKPTLRPALPRLHLQGRHLVGFGASPVHYLAERRQRDTCKWGKESKQPALTRLARENDSLFGALPDMFNDD
jgi:hypothetical protein